MYWQWPNPWLEVSRQIDFFVQKNAPGKRQKYDPEDTVLVLKFDTPDIGELVVIIEIKGRKITYTFHSERGDTKAYIGVLTKSLRDSMASLNYDLVGVKNIQKRIDIKKWISPKMSLDDFKRIIAEA